MVTSDQASSSPPRLLRLVQNHNKKRQRNLSIHQTCMFSLWMRMKSETRDHHQFNAELKKNQRWLVSNEITFKNFCNTVNRSIRIDFLRPPQTMVHRVKFHGQLQQGMLLSCKDHWTLKNKKKCSR